MGKFLATKYNFMYISRTLNPAVNYFIYERRRNTFSITSQNQAAELKN